MLLSNDSFKAKDIIGSYVSASDYNDKTKSNAFKIKLSGFLDFSNGENLEVLFCKEDASGFSCRAHTSPPALTPDNVPTLINDKAPKNSFSFNVIWKFISIFSPIRQRKIVILYLLTIIIFVIVGVSMMAPKFLEVQ